MMCGQVTEPLLDRQAELDVIVSAARAAVGGNGGTLFVEGPAGIGKTGLIRAGRRIASDLTLLVLTARGAELERDFGFGLVRQLFEPVRHRSELIKVALTGTARRAAALLELDLSEGAPLPGGPDAAPAMLSALYRLTSNLARSTPLALLVDDVHWADPRRGGSYAFWRVGSRASQSCWSSPAGPEARPLHRCCLTMTSRFFARDLSVRRPWRSWSAPLSRTRPMTCAAAASLHREETRSCCVSWPER